MPRTSKDNRIVFGSLPAEMAMSILDDAIREHLELKRAHGADEAELKRLEDEAFGPPRRPEEPDPFAEAPTEYLAAAEGAAEVGAGEGAGAPSGRREPNIADLQEPPPRAEAAPEAPPQAETAPEAPSAEPADEAQPAGEHQAIADQPTELFDVEAEIGETQDAPADAPAPSDEDLVDAEHAEPRLAPVDPLDGIEASAAEAEAAEEPLLDDEEEEDDFFSEQRLSDELNQALETPLPGEPTAGPATEEHIPPGPHTEEAEAHYAERELEEEQDEVEHGDEEDDEESEQPADAHEPEDAKHEDVLEDTPEFLEDAPEDDDLWFEQRPPKDFDFDD
jgi:hypothetical protein